MTDPAYTTFRDGVGCERCALCKQVVRMKGGAPTVPVLLSDVEEIVCFLIVALGHREAWAALIQRLQQTAGRTVAQMQADT